MGGDKERCGELCEVWRSVLGCERGVWRYGDVSGGAGSVGKYGERCNVVLWGVGEACGGMGM